MADRHVEGKIWNKRNGSDGKNEANHADAHEANATFLRRLREQADGSQQAFMTNISSRLGRPRPTEPPKRSVKGAPEFWAEQMALSAEAGIARLMDYWKQTGGHAERFAEMDEAVAFVERLYRELQARRVILQDQAELREFRDRLGAAGAELTVWNAEEADRAGKDELLAAAADADIGLVAADWAVAATGSLVVRSSPRQGRSVSLLPAVLIAIVPADRIRRTLGEVLRPLDELPQSERPAGVHFITGPSRSSDIENDLTIGVHGPGIVYALIVG